MLDAESRRRELQGVTSYPYVGNPLIGFSSPDPGFVSGKKLIFLFVFLRVPSWFFVPLRGDLFLPLRVTSWIPFVDIFLFFVPLRGLRADVSYHC